MTEKTQEILLAATIFLGSLAVAVVSFQKISQPGQSRVELGVVSAGIQNYLVYEGEGCVGAFETLLEKEELTRLRFALRARISLGREVSEVNISWEGFFNPMDQMVRSQLSSHGFGSKFSISSQEVFPMQVEFRAETGGKTYQQAFDLPGPVFLHQDHQTEKISLDYPGFNEVMATSFLQNEMLKSVNVSKVQQETVSKYKTIRVAPGATCPPEKQSSISVPLQLLSVVPFLRERSAL